VTDPRRLEHHPRRPPRAGLALVVVALLVVVIVVLVLVVDSSDDARNPVETRTETGTAASDTAAAEPIPTTTTNATAALPSKPSATPTAARPLRLWVGGDSLAAGPSWAVFEDASATGVVKPLAEYQVGTGLVRNEFWDWPKHMDAVVRARNPQVSVFMVGANDDQGIEVDGTSYQPPAPEWVAEYRRRVAALMKTLTRDGRRLIWVGMPPMQDATYSESMHTVNQVFQSEATKHERVAYVDTWTMFSEPGAPGAYAQYLPGADGSPVNVRLDDGIHLNVEGSQLLSRAVMAELAKFVRLPPS
jgi:hypothetical protein